MDVFSLPVFHIESEDEEHDDAEDRAENADHLQKLLNERDTLVPRNRLQVQKKLEGLAEDNLLRKDLRESVCLFCTFCLVCVDE